MESNLMILFINGFTNALHPYHIILMCLGVIGGIIIGTLPGLTATMATALLVPFTFRMNPSAGLVLLGAVWCGGVYGGANSAILLNIPGTPSSFATTLDGYPLTKRGDADLALIMSLISSVIGGIFGVLVLAALFAPLARFSVKFGKAEYFWLCIFGLTTISALSSKDLLKGLLGGAIGLLLGTIGLSPISAGPRFTFGYMPLIQGVALIPALIGMFAFSQALTMVEHDEKYIATYKHRKGITKKVFKYLFSKCKLLLLKSSIIGTFIGILPGAGGSVASIISYNEARRSDKNPEKYGEGAIEGIIASETANNAVIGGACIPMLGLGIPGAPVAAIIMGGLLAHGIIPGSKLLVESGNIAYDFIAALLLSNIIMLFIGYFMIKLTANCLRIPSYFIVPIILVLSTIGSYTMRNSLLDVKIMFIVGILSFILSKVGISPAPMSLGLILGPIAEESLGISLVIAKAKGSILQVLVCRPLSILLILLSIITMLTPIFLEKYKKRSLD